MTSEPVAVELRFEGDLATWLRRWADDHHDGNVAAAVTELVAAAHRLDGTRPSATTLLRALFSPDEAAVTGQ